MAIWGNVPPCRSAHRTLSPDATGTNATSWGNQMKCTFLAAALTVVACLAGASGAAAAAAPADEVGPQVVVHSSLFLKVGSALSDSSPSAYIPANITWTA